MNPGARPVTSVDVAREAGVSQTTVSRVLNGAARVAPASRDRVDAAIAKLGYRPNLSARSLITQRTGTVGVVLGDLSNSYYAALLAIVNAEVAAAGYRTLVLSTREDRGDLADLLWASNVDGVVVTTSLLTADDERRIADLPVPTVSMGPHRLAGIDTVSPDNATGGRLAAQHLLQLGHRRVGIVAGPLDAVAVRDRRDGFLAELGAAGVTVEGSSIVAAEFEYARAYAVAQTLFSRRPRPTALFCENDLMALAALNAARATGVRVPEDVSVLGFDDVAMAEWESFRLSTVRLPMREMAVGAAAALLERFARPDAPNSRVLLPCSLVVRETTGPPRTA